MDSSLFTRIQLRHDARKTPDIYLHVIRKTQYNLRGPVVTALDVGVESLIREATGAKIRQLYARLVGLLKQDILRLEVAVDYVLLSQEMDRV